MIVNEEPCYDDALDDLPMSTTGCTATHEDQFRGRQNPAAKYPPNTSTTTQQATRVTRSGRVNQRPAFLNDYVTFTIFI